MRLARGFDIRKVKGFVFLDRSADSSPELIPFQNVLGTGRKVIMGVNNIVANEVIKRAVYFIGAAFHADAYDVGSMAILCWHVG